MIAAWLVTLLSIVLVVELLLLIGGETPSAAWHWTVAVVTGALAFGMTYGMPAWLCWWALRKARKTGRASSWVWMATMVLMLTSFIFGSGPINNRRAQFCLPLQQTSLSRTHPALGKGNIVRGGPAQRTTFREMSKKVYARPCNAAVV